MSSELPEPWGGLLEPKGIHSYRDLGAAAGVGHETARRLVLGGRTSTATVKKVADALFAGDRDRVWELHGSGLVDHGEWTLPPEASLLNEEQRTAVLAVVRAMLPAIAKQESDDRADSIASVTEGPWGPLDEDLDALPDEADDPAPIVGRSRKAAARKDDKK